MYTISPVGPNPNHRCVRQVIREPVDGALVCHQRLGSQRIRRTPAQPFLATASPATQLRMDSGVTCVKTCPAKGYSAEGRFFGRRYPAAHFTVSDTTPAPSAPSKPREWIGQVEGPGTEIFLLRQDALSGRWVAQTGDPLTTGHVELVASLEAGHSNSQSVSRQQVRFLDVLAVNQRAVA